MHLRLLWKETVLANGPALVGRRYQRPLTRLQVKPTLQALARDQIDSYRSE